MDRSKCRRSARTQEFVHQRFDVREGAENGMFMALEGDIRVVVDCLDEEFARQAVFVQLKDQHGAIAWDRGRRLQLKRLNERNNGVIVAREQRELMWAAFLS